MSRRYHRHRHTRIDTLLFPSPYPYPPPLPYPCYLPYLPYGLPPFPPPLPLAAPLPSAAAFDPPNTAFEPLSEHHVPPQPAPHQTPPNPAAGSYTGTAPPAPSGYPDPSRPSIFAAGAAAGGAAAAPSSGLPGYAGQPPPPPGQAGYPGQPPAPRPAGPSYPGAAPPPPGYDDDASSSSSSSHGFRDRIKDKFEGAQKFFGKF